MFSHNHLPFGITSPPSVFQRVMDQVLPHVHCFLKDILITGENDETHLKKIEMLCCGGWKKLACGFRGINASSSKVQWSTWDMLMKNGISPRRKLRANAEAPSLTNVGQLLSLLWLIMYDVRFVKNMATTVSPLHELLHAGVAWV